MTSEYIIGLLINIIDTEILQSKIQYVTKKKLLTLHDTNIRINRNFYIIL